jgi:hypothetical protein
MAILSDTVDMVTSLADGDFDFADITTPIAVGTDLLAAALDPVGALIAAPLGELLNFVVHHCKFIAEPLAKLEGSDELVEAQAKAWDSVANEYIAAGNHHAGGISDMPGWTGNASGAYHDILKATNEAFAAVADAARGMGMGVRAAGVLVGMLRGFIWDMISQLLASAISSGIAALAAAIPTVGASLAAFAGWYTAKVGAVAIKIAGFISKLLGKAAKFSKKCAWLSNAFKKAQKHCDAIVGQLRQAQKFAGRTIAPKVTRGNRQTNVPKGALPGDTTAPHGPGRAVPPPGKGPIDAPDPRDLDPVGAAKDNIMKGGVSAADQGLDEALDGDPELTRIR